MCGSGLASVALAYNSLLCGDGKVMVAGGQESMSNAPHFANLRNGIKMGPGTLTDSMIVDGLWDAYNNYHMGITAENVAEKYKISREDQDTFASSSKEKQLKQLMKRNLKMKLNAISTKNKEKTFDTDEYPKVRIQTVDKLSQLRPVLKKDGIRSIAGNASGINDGVAAVVLMTAEEAKKRKN